MPIELWIAVLSGSLVSGIVGALIAGWFALSSKRSEYANEYFKLVLRRRIDAYEDVERLIVSLKSSVLGNDQRPYHLLFSKDDDHEAVYKLMLSILSTSLWLSDDLFELTRDLNILIFQEAGSDAGLIEFGKTNYRNIAELRTKLETFHARDMQRLHDVGRFLKSKRPSDKYSILHRRG